MQLAFHSKMIIYNIVSSHIVPIVPAVTEYHQGILVGSAADRVYMTEVC